MTKLKDKPCKSCGSAFTPPSPANRFCSSECRERTRKAKDKESDRKRREEGYRYTPQNPCHFCGGKPVTTLIYPPVSETNSISFCKKCYTWVNRWVRFRLSKQQFDNIYTEQNGCCAICKKPQQDCQPILDNGELKDFCVDHDHSTGRVRGLLCNKCNFILGNAMDDTKILESAIKYLGKHS